MPQALSTRSGRISYSPPDREYFAAGAKLNDLSSGQPEGEVRGDGNLRSSQTATRFDRQGQR